jgi:hypothetical protein
MSPLRSAAILIGALSALVACSASSGGTTEPASSGSSSGSGSGGSSSATTSGGCTYGLFGQQCEEFSHVTTQQLMGELHACETVFGGTAVDACPTTGIVGACKNVTPANGGTAETIEIFYYNFDGGEILSPADLCMNSDGTYSPTP